MGWEVNRTVNGATNGMGRLQDDGWEDERDGISTRTMHGAMNGMGRKLGGYGWARMNAMERRMRRNESIFRCRTTWTRLSRRLWRKPRSYPAMPTTTGTTT
jgi:hypothetical protein